MTPKKGANNDATAIAAQASEWKAKLDDGLSLSEKAEFNVWIEADARHREALDRFDRVWTEFDRPYQAGVTKELMEELKQRGRRRRRRRVISTASVLLLFLTAGLVWQAGDGAPVADSERIADTASTSAVVLTPIRKTLPDGSVVELKEGAEIAVQFTSEIRRVELLRGEAHFQVTKDAARPFIVSAQRVETRAIGTGFTVGIQSGRVEIIVTEGVVTVAQNALTPPSIVATAPALETGVALQASNRTVVRLGASSKVPLTVDTVPADELADRLAWRVPRVEFTRTSLADAVAVLNGFADSRRLAGAESVQFVIADAVTAATRVSGLFRADRTEVFISLLKHGLGIEAENRGDGEILLKLAAEQKP